MNSTARVVADWVIVLILKHCKHATIRFEDFDDIQDDQLSTNKVIVLLRILCTSMDIHFLASAH